MALPLLVFAAALIGAGVLTPLAARLARRLGIVDRPGGRKEHVEATPLLGGAAVFAVFAAALAGGAVFYEPAQAGRIGGLLAGLAVAFATGVIDDTRKDRFPAGAKLAGQIAAAAIAVAAGARADLFVHPVANQLMSALWIVTIMNAVNFLDHADGLAAGTSVIATAIFAVVAGVQGQDAMALALAALAGATAGFLVHNYPPAGIFLGDAGALTIGYALGSLTLLESYVTRRSPGYLPALLPPIVLAVPLFDMAVVVLARLRAGKPVYVGDRNHLHHRLVRLGMSPRAALHTAYLLTLALGAGAMALPDASWVGAVAIGLQALAVMGLVAILMFFGGTRGRPEA